LIYPFAIPMPDELDRPLLVGVRHVLLGSQVNADP
jgi:hypothetical protein